MKNLLKLTFIAASFSLCTGAMAQEVKKDAPNSSTQTEAPKPAEAKPAPSPATPKQEPVKPGGTATSKSDAKSDTTKSGGTRMAITEQGMPRKNKNKGKTATTTTTTTTPDASKSDQPKK
ncbi:MAG: hypothetical protein H0X46_09730 [Bacteroidetes bacterium]|nr:hypothetical protein [Bacteroidota bacterium]